MRSIRSFADSLTGGASIRPLPRSARKTAPEDLDHAADVTSPIVTPSRSGAAATDTQHDSRPARAGRVPSIGSTTRTVGRRRAPAGRVLRVEGHVRGAGREEVVEGQLLGLGVDREGHVAALDLPPRARARLGASAAGRSRAGRAPGRGRGLTRLLRSGASGAARSTVRLRLPSRAYGTSSPGLLRLMIAASRSSP